MTIGLDFDNTLVSYDRLLAGLAQERGLIGPGLFSGKRRIRDAVRDRPGGEMDWQRLQAAAYGPLMDRAELSSGAAEFLARCREEKVKVYIVSHKSEYAAADETKTSLRQAARKWMAAQDFFGRLGLAEEAVFFEETRAEKISRIASLGLSLFIDDLVETFLESSWPGEVRRILYSPQGAPAAGADWTVCASWEEIGEHVFVPGR